MLAEALRRGSETSGFAEHWHPDTGAPQGARPQSWATLAAEHGLPRPRWTRAVGPLQEEWAAPGTPRMRAEAAATTPEPFRRRNLVLARSALFRQAA